MMELLFDTWIETEQPGSYHGWPTLIERSNGQLAAVCSGGRQGHICPFGRVYLYTSDDGGRSWSEPHALSNGPLDDRDAGIVELPDGTLLVNYFTSLAFLNLHEAGKAPESWQYIEERINLSTLKSEHGFFLLPSTDGGRSWSEKRPVPVNNVHGPALLADGSLLWVGRELAWSSSQESRMGERMAVYRSDDGGAHWQIVSVLPGVAGQSQRDWHEAHAIQAADGSIVAQFRNQSLSRRQTELTTWQTESYDGGRTWTAPHEVTCGVPSHLLRLPDGRLLMSYGFRRKPYGNRYRLSDDNGRSWSEEQPISIDGECDDLGYPSSICRPDGSLVTLWYQYRSDLQRALLRCRGWRLE